MIRSISGTFSTRLQKAQSYLQDVDEGLFLADSLIQDGVIWQIEIIGEAARRLSGELRSQHAHIPWEDIARMRDKLIHDYFGVDLDNRMGAAPSTVASWQCRQTSNDLSPADCKFDLCNTCT